MSVSINISDIISKAFALGKSGEELTAEFVLNLLKDVPVAKSGGRPKKTSVESDTETAPKKRPATKKVITEEMMCCARTFTKDHVDSETGKLKVFEEHGEENKYGGRCSKAHTDGQFCTVHAKDPKFGVWGEDYEGALRNRIRDEKLGKIRKPKAKGVHSDVESETEEAPKKRNPKKKATEDEPKKVEKSEPKSMAEALGIADADTEEDEEVVMTTYVKKEFEGHVWMVDEKTGDVYGMAGETLHSKPIGRLSTKKDFKRWLSKPAFLEEDEDDM